MVRSSSTPTTVGSQSPGLWKYVNPLHLARNLWRHRELIRQFTRREIEGRYRGSFLGLFWSFVNPLVLLLIYTFVFGVVFKSRWPAARTDSLGEFAVIIFCGFTAFNVFGESMARAATLIVGVPNYVKKVVFPLEILPVSALGAALFHSAINLGILLVANLLLNRSFSWTLVLLPLVALPLIFLCLGLTWFLSSLGVFVRDINHVITLIVQVLFFTSAIFYSIDKIPEPYRTLIHLNPLTPIVENYRRVILWSMAPSWPGLALWLSSTAALMMLGYAWFMKTKKAFADVL